MTAGTLNPVQLPASLRAVDAVADKFHVSARSVGCRVYGHRGGLTVRERYILAEKREDYLKQTREAAYLQRQRQRHLRGGLIRVEKDARRMLLQASMPCGREEAGGRTTHNVVASIRSAGTQRSADLSVSRDDSDVGLDISGHVDKVRAVFERMEHTFNMARARSNLRAAINGLRQNSATSTTVGERDGNTYLSVDADNTDIGSKENTGFLRRSCDDDPGGTSPRDRHLRRRAATCLQKCIRGRLVRRSFQDLVWPALHICGSEATHQRSLDGKESRRAMLLAHFRVVRAAYEVLKPVLLTPRNHRAGSEHVHHHKPGSARAPSYGEDATQLPNDTGFESSPSHSCGTADAAVQRTVTGGGLVHEIENKLTRKTGEGEEQEQHGIPSSADDVKGSTTYADEADNEEVCGWYNRGAAKAARRESRVVLWALRDAAARVVQEETRNYARRRRWMSGLGKRRDTATTDGTTLEENIPESSTREVEDRFDGWHQETGGGLPYGLQARLSTAVTTTSTATTTASSTRGTTARKSTARTTATTSSTRRTQGDNSGQTAREDEDRLDGRFQAAGGGLQWGPQARMSTAVTSASTATTTASSTRGTTARTSTARTAATANSERTPQGGCGGQSTSSVSNRSPIAVESAVSPTYRSLQIAGTDVDNVTPELEWGSEEAWEGGRLHTQQEEVVSRSAHGVAARWPLLPSEEFKKRRNEIHLRRNKSRLRRAERGLVNLECQGTFVLPEIIYLQRLFRARRARITYDRGQANEEEKQAAWEANEARERKERASRWQTSMSRLNAVRLPFSKEQRNGLSGTVRKAAQVSCKDEEEDMPHQGVLGDLRGKDAPYASAVWSLAVAYDVGSWRGGLRQRHYFGRLMAFLNYRRRRKAALRARVEVRMVKRLQAWAALLSEEKRSLACEVKARAPAEVVGAHLRFIARTGTWERLLLDLHEILKLAVSEREQAVGLLWGQVSSETPGAPQHILRSPFETPATSPLPGSGGSTSPSRNAAHPQHPRKRFRCSSSGQQERWAAGSLPISGRLLVGGSPHHPVGSRQVSRAASRAECRRLERLRGVVDERTLRCLHPWIVSALAGSDLQFVPSVPQKERVGYRMDDTNKVELRAEKQLTRRYWTLLGGISDAVSRVVAAKVEAATLAAEAGEWNLLLGFAHDLRAKGIIDPPCMLPRVPLRSATDGNIGSNVGLLGVMAKRINFFLAPVRRRRAGGGGLHRNSTSARSIRQAGPAQEPELHCRPMSPSDKAEATKQEGSGNTMSSVPSWFSAKKNLCDSCWAMRTGHSAAGGSKCQRCGQTHRRGFAQDVSKRGAVANIVQWKRFSQVQEPLDLFVVHAAYACVLHPGCEKEASLPGCGSLGWWNGGNSEELWWRAVCGGKRAARVLHSRGCNTLGELYTFVHGSAAAFSSSPKGGGELFTRKVRARTRRLRRLVKDEDLAVKISSLLLRLMSAFEELRTQNRWPTVPKTAVHHAVRKLQLPRTLGTASKRSTARTTPTRGQPCMSDGGCFDLHGGETP